MEPPTGAISEEDSGDEDGDVTMANLTGAQLRAAAVAVINPGDEDETHVGESDSDEEMIPLSKKICN
jgi:hypothetical protein